MGAKACLIVAAALGMGCGTGSSTQGIDGNSDTGGSQGSGGAGGLGGMTTARTGGGDGRATGGARGGTGGKATGGGTGQGGQGGAAGGRGTGQGGQGGAAGGGGTVSAGNPSGSCSAGVPARGQPVDTSTPTSKIGTGTPESCDFGQLATAVAKGGIITFDCGVAAHTVTVTATLKLPINKNTIIDGGGRITLDGAGAVQIMRFDGTDWMKNANTVTLQHITLMGGKTTPSEAIPTAPSPCSQGYNDGEGGAVYVRDGNLVVIDAIFINNQAAPLGPDTGGGAIYINGSKDGVLIVGSSFVGNKASNAGAVGCLFAELDVYNSLFQNNQAIGHDANNDDATKCSAINNGQHEIGSGGNGGALYNDGASKNITLCGNAILNNAAGQNAFGGGLFFTSNDFGGTLTVVDTTMTGNTGGSWTQVSGGSVTNAGTAVGTNAKSITITSSTLQGVK